MTDLELARAQMALSLGFHIVFAAIGVAMPLLMVLAELRWLRTGDAEYLALAKRWAKGTAIFFAVGAVSGTVLSFELGLLFPGFMAHAGAVIGVPFSLESVAFFVEAVCLGLYLYGWDRLSRRAHVLAGVGVAVSGLASAVFVTIVNAWMNAPRGFTLEAGKIVDVDHVAAMTTPAALHETVHMALAAYLSTAIAVAAIHAYMLRRTASAFHRKALSLALAVAVPCALLQPITGHFAAQRVADLQPLKFAAMEDLHETQPYAPITFGPVEIPGLLSLLAHDDPSAVVIGLDRFPATDHPHPITHVAFDVMIALGVAMALHALVASIHLIRRRRWPTSRRFLLITMLLGPAGVLAMEAGWVVTEVGRQPWVVYGIQRTAEAVTPMPGLIGPFITFACVYALLAAVVVLALWRQVRATEAPPP